MASGSVAHSGRISALRTSGLVSLEATEWQCMSTLAGIAAMEMPLPSASAILVPCSIAW